MSINKEPVLTVLQSVRYPAHSPDIVSLGLVREVAVDGNAIRSKQLALREPMRGSGERQDLGYGAPSHRRELLRASATAPRRFQATRALAAVCLALAVVAMGCPARVDAQTAGPPFRWGGSSSPNMALDVTNLPADPGKATPLWDLKLGTHQYSVPTVDRGRIYIGANDAAVDRTGYKPTGGGALLCIEQATARRIWTLPIPRNLDGVKAPYHFDQWNCGVCSGPVVDRNRVYIVGSRGDILCLDREGQANGNDGTFQDELAYMGMAGTPDSKLEANDGDILWRYDLLTELGINGHDVVGSTLLLHGDFLYATTGNGIDDRHDKVPCPLAPSLVVLDKRSGRLLARDEEKIGARLLHCLWSSPCGGRVGGRTLIFFGGGDGVLYAFEEPAVVGPTAPLQTLRRVWSYDCNPPHYRMRDGKPLPYSKHSQNRPDGPSEIIGTPVFYEDRVYVAIGQSPLHGVGQGSLVCVDAATGTPVWTSQLVERTLATVAIADGLLYLPDYTGNLHCFDAATGQRQWVQDLGSKTWGSSAFVADGKVFVGTEANVLWVFKTGRQTQVLSRTRLKSTPITPTAAPGVLYIPTQKSLIAVPGGAEDRSAAAHSGGG